MSRPIVIVGASARSAAASAIRAGFAPYAADLFADLDLAECCPTLRVDHYPHGFAVAIREFPPAPWMYTGGLENYPDIVDAISQERPLLGNAGNVLSAVRNPVKLAAALRAGGLDVPETTLTPPLDQPGAWLQKPLGSAAGFGVRRFARSPAAARNTANRPVSDKATNPDGNSASARDSYFQQFISGTPCSAIFVGTGQSATLIGVSEQLIGCPWLGSTGFHYSGSIGPLPISPVATVTWQQLGSCVASTFRLAGLFGVDAVFDGERVWPVEVNPRYPASVEIFERSFAWSAIAVHVAAVELAQSDHPHRENALEQPQSGSPRATLVCGKAIVFAKQRTRIRQDVLDLATSLNSNAIWPLFADLPRSGTMVARQEPVLTVFAEGHDVEDVRTKLQERAAEVYAVLSQSE